MKYIYGNITKHINGIKYGNFSTVVFNIKSLMKRAVTKYL